MTDFRSAACSIFKPRILLCVLLSLLIAEFFVLATKYGGRKYVIYRTSKPTANLGLSRNCKKTLENLTKGTWVKKITLLSDPGSSEYRRLVMLEKEVDEQLKTFRRERGIHMSMWREDGVCGFSNLQAQPPGSAWDRVGSWCEADSETPCCSDMENGTCSSSFESCNCSSCVDMRRIIHADVADWVPTDARCRARHFVGVEACKALSKFSEIHLVGDSLIVKLYAALIMTMKSDYETGVHMKTFTTEQKRRCVGNAHFYWKECRFVDGNVADLLNTSSLCGGQMDLPFNLSCEVFYSQAESKDFLRLVKSLAGKQGSLIVLGIGLHFGCKSSAVIERYLGPAVSFLEAFHDGRETGIEGYVRWPVIIFIPPDNPGLLKPPVYLPHNGAEICRKYTQEMARYCGEHNIPVLSFDDLTKNVHSYDGTHYGRAVNLMKAQLLLNYVDEATNVHDHGKSR